MIDQSMLLNKLEYCGFRGQVNDFLKSYLLDRKIITKINITLSSELYIIYSVPRRSVLGTLFFIIFINDISNILNDNDNINLNLYSDEPHYLYMLFLIMK